MGGRGGGSHRAGSGGLDLSEAQTFLTDAYGGAHAYEIMEILRKAPPHVQSLWSEYASEFRADPSANRNDGNSAYYSPYHDWVYLGINSVARGNAISTPYSVAFHEYGHMTDYLIARDYGYASSSYSDLYHGIDEYGRAMISYRSEGLLGKTAKAELDEHITRIMRQHPAWSRDEAAKELASEAKQKFSRRDRADISDMMEGAGIGIEYPLGAGHGLDYWSIRGNGKEIFAEMISAEAAHPGSLKAIKFYFPKTYQVYRDMLKARRKR